MSYTVFALKWRPQNFDEIVGQNHIVLTLKNAIEKNRLAHAYLFAGPRGVGKTSTARILAKALNCKSGPTVNPCNKCSSCREISEGRSLDVIEIDGASNRGIDEIRVLRENVKFSPVSGKFKIYIIDEVHMLTQEAFNALLKTLEEPPEFVKFIFATTAAHKVIPTILSRCQRFDFRRIPALEISSQLERIVKSEKIDIDREVLFAIAKSSDGSLRDAESILDQLASFSKQKISLQDVVSVFGIIEQEAMQAIIDKIAQKDAKGILELLDRLIEEGKDTGLFLSSLIEYFRNLMIAKVTLGDPKLIDLPQELCQTLLQQSELFSLEEIFSAFNVLVNTQEMSKRLASARIPIEISLVKLAHNKRSSATLPQQPKLQVKKTPEPKQEEIAEDKPPVRVNDENKETPEPGPVENEPSQEISLDTIKQSWRSVINNLKSIKMSVASYLDEGEPIKFKKDVLVVSFPKNCSLHKEALEKKDNKEIIEKVASQIYNLKLRINLILSNEVRHKETGENSPFIKSALEAFNARFIKEE